MATQDRSRAQILAQLNTPGVTSVLVKNATTGELTITARGPGALDLVRVTFDSRQIINLLDYAVNTWWVNSPTLLDAVDNGWITIPSSQNILIQGSVTSPDVAYIVAPNSPTLGDLLVWNGLSWVVFPAGTSGYVITSNGPGTLPTYQIVAGGAGGDGDTITGQTTAGLTDGDLCYVSANSTWLKARSDGSRQQATLAGAFAGTSGSVLISGRLASAKFTTAGGTPTPGLEVYLAANADDGGAGAGKLTGVQPSSGYATVAGVCLDNTNYAGLKTCIVLLNPQSPIQL